MKSWQKVLLLSATGLMSESAYAVLADNVSSDRTIDIYTDHDETGDEGLIIWAGQDGIYGDDSPSQYRLAEFGTNGTSAIYTPLTVTGATTLQSSLGVTGATSLNNTLAVNSGGGTQELSVTTNTVTATGETTLQSASSGNNRAIISANTTQASVTYVDGSGVSNGLAVTGTQTSVSSGDSNLTLESGSSTLSSGTAGGYKTYTNDTTLVSGAAGADQYQLQYGDAETKSLVEGASVRNIIIGDTAVDGSLYVNGPVTQSSSTSVTTVVTDVDGTTGGSSAAVKGEAALVVDENGKLETGTAEQTTAAVTVTNSAGNVHGFYVNESQATISGGVNSTSLTLNDSGARFSNSANGNPVTVTGVADGVNDFDAVNVRQFKKAYKKAYAGIAGVAAMAQLPSPAPGKKYSIGIGTGYYESQTALALGLKAMPNDRTTLSFGVTHNSEGGSVAGAGLGWSW